MAKTFVPPTGSLVPTFVTYGINNFDGGSVGDIYYVNSATGTDDTQHGRTPDSPLATISYAVAHCTADNNDLVLVAPNHTETITAAAGVNMNVAGVTLRGLGIGRQRGTINYTTAAAASFDINAARCCVQNLTFTGMGVASVTAMVNVKAADCTIGGPLGLGCEFEHANATNQAADVIITTSAANRLWVIGNDFHGSANAGTNHAITIVGGTDIEVYWNNFQGSYHVSDGIVRVITTATKNLVIDSNTFQNGTASNTKAISDTITGSTGQIRFNTMQILSGTAPITGATFSWVGNNYYAATIATAGTLI